MSFASDSLTDLYTVVVLDFVAEYAVTAFTTAPPAVPATVHCDHLIQANIGAKADIETATKGNSEVYDFLHSVSDKFGIGFWKPGAGIIHQVVLSLPNGIIIR